MELALDISPAGMRYHIHEYHEGRHFLINQRPFAHSVVVLPDSLHPWQPTSLADLQAAHCLMIIELRPEFVLLGTGARHEFPPTALLAPFYARNIGVEIMSTAAACRTYTLLASDGRRVAAAMLL